MDDMLTASVRAVLADLCPPALVRAVEAARDPGGARDASRDLWRQLDALGLFDALTPEARGGAGLPMADGVGALLAFGEYALPLPAAHTMIARPWLAEARLAAPRGPITLAMRLATADDARRGVAAESAPDGVAAAPAPNGAVVEFAPNGVATAFAPYGTVAEAMLVETPEGARLIDLAAAQVQHRGNSLDATVAFSPGAGRLVPSVPRHGIAERGALVTAATMAGAMQRVQDMTIAYVNGRQQFGRPIGKFQAVQQQLSVMAEHVVAASMAAQLGAAAHGTRAQRLASAIAKACASRAAPRVAGTAHGLVGAMGITAEFDLQIYTRRLHAERLHYGTESFWDEIVGAHALAQWDSAAHGVIGLFGALDAAASAF